ncbi:aldose 1-epimerase family protein [Roseomonas sp. OT10]|uniref:aldose 1-epimerase family protein n=1 Tax=Roseomonas cutis TaxID=2897332 RepID=UPI001E4C1402|nr:aldose 1-epimerase family protein [Roseomonas sp. OT10]UFN49497.1 aldose 1-epimerase family protein [Roseomonas sp. OT10]
MTESHTLTDGTLTATVAAQGAELHSLRDAAGAEWLWQAGPEWPRHAPILFPVVGRLSGDVLRHEGVDYPMGQHGFARDRRFEWLSRGPSACALRLTDDTATRAVYPFAFLLDVAYAIEGGALSCTVTVRNPAETPLLFSVGGHPGFAWPLPGGGEKTAHSLTFGTPEPGPAQGVREGLLHGTHPLPGDGKTLRLDESLFATDAIVLLGARSRSIRYAADSGPTLEMRWDDYRDLGLWSKPGGAPFLCLEPWRGHASPFGWQGEFADKPGVVTLPPGEALRLRWSVRLFP